MPLKTPLFGPDTVPRYAYFLTSGAASVVADMENGGAMEVSLIGNEGLPGGIHLLGPQTGPNRCFMQVEGTGLRIEFKRLQEVFRTVPALQRRILQYVQAESLMLGQLSACNRFHEMEERLARWLLMVADRLQQDELPLTQEFLADMLGARRSSVTVVAGTLQRSGLLEYRRGVVRILNRRNLEDAACECYPIVRRLQETLYQDAVGS